MKNLSRLIVFPFYFFAGILGAIVIFVIIGVGFGLSPAYRSIVEWIYSQFFGLLFMQIVAFCIWFIGANFTIAFLNKRIKFLRSQDIHMLAAISAGTLWLFLWLIGDWWMFN